jgi:hypothetical protein
MPLIEELEDVEEEAIVAFFNCCTCITMEELGMTTQL